MMIKKNLFLLVSFYFFVLQSLFVGLLRGDINFYRLALINFVFIVVIAFFSKEKRELLVDKVDVKHSSKEEKIKKIKIVKDYKPIPHIWLFIISVLFGFLSWFWLGDMTLSLQLFISVAGSFIIFVLFSFLFRFAIFKVRETKIYIVVLIGLSIWSSVVYFDLTMTFLNIDTYFDKINFISQDKNHNVDMDTSDRGELVFVSEDGLVTGSVSDLVLSGAKENTLSKEELEKKATFADVIKSLMDQNNIILNTTKNIKFNHVPTSSEDYAYYRTAYDKKLIGKTVNPTKTLLCETYIVMKGLVSGRDVGSYRDIKKAYWDYAKNNNNLSTCEYGNYVKIGDLD